MGLENKFNEHFNENHELKYFAPGRINLIGEHIDYSGGLVLPCAITIGTTALVSKRDDKLLKFYSLNMEDEGVITVDLADIVYSKKDSWANYTKGVFKVFSDNGYNIDYGLNIAYHGNIPYASGLSSSASILMVTAVLINDVYGFKIGMLDLVKIAKTVENDFIGVSTGIMDQFAIGFGKKDHCILLNTNTLDYEYIPLELADNSIVIMNTNKKRGLADSAYNERKADCDNAFDKLSEHYSIDYLCDLNIEQLEAQRSLLSDIEYKRAYHAISENARTKKAAEVLKAGDLKAFGDLMVASHKSLREDYEVTGIELDTLVDRANNIKGVLGARVTGAGFGGCAIAIVNNSIVDDFIEEVGQHYLNKIGYAADFYVATAGDGAKKIS